MKHLHDISRLLSAALVAATVFACSKDEITIQPPEPTPSPADTTHINPTPTPTPTPEPEDTLALLPYWHRVEHFPSITINTTDGVGVTSKTQYVTGTIVFSDPDGMYSDSTEVSTTLRIRGRGNSTWDHRKKPYRVKLDVKHKVFGMKGDRDWVLLAERTDRTLLRNQVSMQISRICGMSWTPDSRSAEVWLDGEYIGLYTLMEKGEIAGAKVDITPADEGGFYIEMDDKDDDDVRARTSVFGKIIKFKDPDNPTEEQKNTVLSAFNTLEDYLNRDDFEHAFPLIDVDSFVSYYLSEEIIKNIDGNMRLSTFFTLDNGILALPYIWDCDLALGNANYFSSEFNFSNDYTGWFIRDCGGYSYNSAYYNYSMGMRSYYPCLFESEEFVKKVQDKWAEIKPALDTVEDYIDALVDAYQDGMSREYEKWSDHYYYSSWEDGYPSEISALKSFYRRRIAWMDSNMSGIGPLK